MNPSDFGLLSIAIGAGIAAPGVIWLAQITQFYLGHRRELYFSQTHRWTTLGRYGFGALFYGLTVITFGLRSYMAPMEFVSVFAFVCGIILVTIAPHLLRRFPPRWLADLERYRSPEERDLICEYGRAMLAAYPHIFRQVIRSLDGWESWLLTIIDPVPIFRFDGHVAYAEDALGNHLYSRTLEVAEQVIHERPDSAVGYHLRARAFLGGYRFADAVLDFDRCIALEPHNANFYYRRARAHLMLDQMEDALADLRIASALQPDNERLAVLREIAARRQRQVDESRS